MSNKSITMTQLIPFSSSQPAVQSLLCQCLPIISLSFLRLNSMTSKKAFLISHTDRNLIKHYIFIQRDPLTTHCVVQGYILSNIGRPIIPGTQAFRDSHLEQADVWMCDVFFLLMYWLSYLYLVNVNRKKYFLFLDYKIWQFTHNLSLSEMIKHIIKKGWKSS
jgi:hypothetical protein